MTLIITELTPVGIAMAADSAITHFESGVVRRITYATKLQAIPYLNAGISTWGIAEIDGSSTSEWLQNFIRSQESLSRNLNTFALELARHMNAHFPRNGTGQSRLGFHLAGYELRDEELLPSFYHIHEGDSQVLASRGIQVDSSQFNANHDLSPEIFRAQQNLIARQNNAAMFIYLTRNGDIGPYVEAFRRLGDFFDTMRHFGIHVPGRPGIDARVEFLRFQIETMEQIYRLSNLHPTIGGDINGLVIPHGGVSLRTFMWPSRFTP